MHGHEPGTPCLTDPVDLLVIGAGPAGIALAVEAVRGGLAPLRILLLEQSAEPAHSIRELYPAHKLVEAEWQGRRADGGGVFDLRDRTKAELLAELDSALLTHGIRVVTREGVRRIERGAAEFVVHCEDGDTYRSRVVAIAIGVYGRPRRPDYRVPGVLRRRVHSDVSSDPLDGGRILVVGGGNGAADYVRDLVERGKRVTLSYRRGSFVRMTESNRRHVEALEGSGWLRVLRDSHVEGLEDDGGRPRARFREGGAETFDHVVHALGGTTPEGFLKGLGIDFDGPRPVLDASGQSSVPGLYLVGDVGGGGSLGEAWASAHRVWAGIADRLGLAAPVTDAPV